MTNENVRFLSSKYRSLVKRRKHRDVRDADRTFSICIININSNDYEQKVFYSCRMPGFRNGILCGSTGK